MSGLSFHLGLLCLNMDLLVLTFYKLSKVMPVLTCLRLSAQLNTKMLFAYDFDLVTL